MSRYYVFYGQQLHSEGPQGSLRHLITGAPEGSIIHDKSDDNMPWFDKYITAIAEEDVPPLLRTMALMLGD